MAVLAALMALAIPISAQAATQPGLGTTRSFAILAGSGITVTGATSKVTGDVGLSPGSALGGFPPGTLNGARHVDDPIAVKAQADLLTAYNSAAAQPFTRDLTGHDLGGLTLTAGVYKFSSSAQLTGTLTLDGQGNPNAVFIFQIGTTLTTASGARVLLINSASPCSVNWQIATSATLGAANSFQGNLLAVTSITVGAATTDSGRALARNGAVTIDTSVITRPSDNCAATTTGGSPSPSPTASPSPSPAGSPAPLPMPPSANAPGTAVPGTGASDTLRAWPWLIVLAGATLLHVSRRQRAR